MVGWLGSKTAHVHVHERKYYTRAKGWAAMADPAASYGSYTYDRVVVMIVVIACM